jgi:hypothetical protein
MENNMYGTFFVVAFAGNILNFNVGAGVDLSVPRNFWKRLAGKYGNLFYWREKASFSF